MLLVLHTDNPKPTGLAFMVGWLIALAVSTALFVQVPNLVDGLDESPPWAPWLRIGIGVLLIVASVGRWVTRKRLTKPPAFLDRLGKVTPAGAAIIGFGLVVANPKVLVMNAAAGLIVGTTTAGAMLWIAVAFYTVLAGSTVTAPILAYAIAGARVDSQLERVKDWMQREHAIVTAIILLVVGVLLTYTGIRAL